MGSEGRRDKRYLAAKQAFNDGTHACSHCGRTGVKLTPDHVPALSTVRDWRTWQGHYIPACIPCQSRQGQRLGTLSRYRRNRWTY